MVSVFFNFPLHLSNAPPSQTTFLRNNELEKHEKTHEDPEDIPCPNDW